MVTVQNYEALSIRARNKKLKMLLAKIALLICYLEINIIVQEGSEIQATGTVEFEDGSSPLRLLVLSC